MTTPPDDTDETDDGIVATYLSFADGPEFLGACIVDETDFVMAIMAAHRYGINPGGSVMSDWYLKSSSD